MAEAQTDSDMSAFTSSTFATNLYDILKRTSGFQCVSLVKQPIIVENSFGDRRYYMLSLQSTMDSRPAFVRQRGLAFSEGLEIDLTVLTEGTLGWQRKAFRFVRFKLPLRFESNIFFSPYSLQVALAMVYTGATGNTAAELQRSLAFSRNKDDLMKAVQASSAALRSSKDVILNTANGVFLQHDYSVKDSFMQAMKNVFEAEAKTVDFAKSPIAAGHINSFVSQKTNGKIPQLFGSDDFNELTKMVLVNAIYFKGSWMHKFDVAETKMDDFYLNNKDKVKVPFMTLTANFNSADNEDLKATIVELPYIGDLRMVLIVPKDIEGLKHVEDNLKRVDLKTVIESTYSKEIKLKMPKFKLEHKMDLNEPLKELGMKDMFSAREAEFGGITDKNDLFVSQVVQKAFIEVNEEGSEAAAATAVRFVMRKMPIPPDEVTVRGPFLFFVRHTRGQVLFGGRVVKL